MLFKIFFVFFSFWRPQCSQSVSCSMLFLAHSGQMIFSPSWEDQISEIKQFSDESFTWINPFPTMETLHWLQKKHSLCQARVSKATNFVLPRPPLPGEICKYYYYMSGCDYLVWDLCDGEWDLSEFNLQKMCRCLCNILKWSKQSTFDTNNMTDLLLVWSRHCTS